MPLFTTFGGVSVKRFGLSAAGARAFFSELLLVAGGGGGGGLARSGTGQNFWPGGGGGAGGYREFSGATAIRMAKGDVFILTVGAGATGNTKGSNSRMGVYCSTGGGFGPHHNSGSDNYGNTGGSGGGGKSPGTGNEGAYTPSEGCPGGRHGYTVVHHYGEHHAGGGNGAPGGGGGAGACGHIGSHFECGTGAHSGAGYGGDGRASSITGSSVHRAGGGGAGAGNGSFGGANQNLNGTSGGNGGGGGQGQAGQVNTGGGGGGTGSNGGSGVVIIAYPSTEAAITTIDAGLTYSVSTVSRSGYRVYTFTAGSGNITI